MARKWCAKCGGHGRVRYGSYVGPCPVCRKGSLWGLVFELTVFASVLCLVAWALSGCHA
jgi:hypothetical protein